ncbi:tape measure protein [Pseudomonas paraeruginosa]|uniref:tape measure protein n=1 Tax=Pseudomonas paraeruginosa TaxID=2994495 RepID=UPI00053F0683|nr:tape measure protein [Pseudomonas paraeruginosa]
MAEVELKITADAVDASKEVAGFRKEYADLVRQVEKPLRQIDAFRKTQEAAKAASAAYFSARKNVDDLKRAMEQAGQPIKALNQEYARAQRALAAATREFDRQKTKVREQRAELKAAGVDTRNLASEQQRLTAELSKQLDAGRADKALTSARQGLGVGEIESVQRQLLALRNQYRLVSSDANLSTKQRAEAEATYRRNVEATLTQLRALRQATMQQATQAQQVIQAEAQRQALAKSGLAQAAAERRMAAVAARQAELEAAKNDLGVNRARAAEAAIERLGRQYQLLRAHGGLTANELARAQETLNQRIRESRWELTGIASAQRSLSIGAGGGIGAALGGAGAVYGSVSAMRAYAGITDTAKKMEAQLKLATSSQDELNRVQQQAFEIAQNAQAPVEDVVAVYARLAPALDQIGRKRDALSVVDALTKALRISGATSAEASSTLIQFSQAMGSGVLRGEEFNAIAEAAPPLMRALASGLGVSVGALRAMASEGQLTAEVITDLTIRALPELTDAAKSLPDTVEGALTRLHNDVLKAFGDGDSSGLITAVTRLRELLTDPATVQALNDLAAGMATLAGWTITAAREFTAFAKELGYAAAAASGDLDELQKLEKALAGVKAARDGGDFIGRPTATLFMTKEQLDAWIKELETKIDTIHARIAGMSVEAYQKLREGTEKQVEAEQAAAEEQAKVEEAKFRHFTKYVGDMQGKQAEAVKNAEAALKKQVSAERKASKALADAKQEQLETQQRYSDALAALGGTGEASYGQAQALKVGARAALVAGDTEKAKQQAQAALSVLQELAQAGENTFGFSGFIQELQAIEAQADQINVDKAQQGLDRVNQQTAELKALLDSVKETQISVKMDDAALSKVRQQIMDLSRLAGNPISIINTAARPDGPAASAGAATGAPGATADVTVSISPATEEKARTDAGALANQMEQELTVEPTVKPPKVYEDGNSFSQFPPVAITPELDPAAAEQAQLQMAGLASNLQRELVIPVTPVATGAPQVYRDGNSFSQFPQEGFAAGGYTGPGGKYEPAGIVHAGEHVQPQEVVREPGALPFLEQIRRYGFRRTLQNLSQSLRGYADGGLVSNALAPTVPAMAGALQLMATPAAPDFPNLGTINLNLGGQTIQAYATPSMAEELHRVALKHGRTGPKR